MVLLAGAAGDPMNRRTSGSQYYKSICPSVGLRPESSIPNLKPCAFKDLTATFCCRAWLSVEYAGIVLRNV